jgi:hypothetical protein
MNTELALQISILAVQIVSIVLSIKEIKNNK